jgi:transcriptional regulator with XRE-family HTH domain
MSGPEPLPTFDPSSFFKALDATVLARGLRWKDVSAQTGVSTSTLSRMAQGRGPDAASMAVLSAWADLNPGDFTSFPRRMTQRAAPLALLTSSLRKDPRLSPESAATLEAVIKATYERLVDGAAQPRGTSVKKP